MWSSSCVVFSFVPCSWFLVTNLRGFTCLLTSHNLSTLTLLCIKCTGNAFKAVHKPTPTVDHYLSMTPPSHSTTQSAPLVTVFRTDLSSVSI